MIHAGHSPAVSTPRRTLAQAIGLHLQRERVARGLTQRRFAEQHGVSQSWLARFALGQSRISLDRVAELFAAFGLLDGLGPGTDGPARARTDALAARHRRRT